MQKASSGIIELVPPLGLFVPPARTLDKSVYSPWFGGELAWTFVAAKIDTVVVSGERQTCAFSPRKCGRSTWASFVVLAKDAISSTSDVAYDKILRLFN
ncbi:MAG: cysteine hydrolase, partial [Pseudomonadota bacterium]